MQYWIIKEGESVGPFSLDELKTLDITPQTKIWFKEIADWTPVGETEVAGQLFPAEPEEEVATSSDADVATTNPIKDEDVPVAASEGAMPPAFDSEKYAESIDRQEVSAPCPPLTFSYGGNAVGNEYEAYQQGYRKGLEEGRLLDKDTDTSKCPPTYLVWSILATVLCCIPVGIVAIVYSSKVRKYYDQNEFLKAKRASDRALYWTLGSAIVWMVTYPIVTALSMLSDSLLGGWF